MSAIYWTNGIARIVCYAIMQSHQPEQRTMTPLQTLRHHVTGAIERGEKTAIVEQTKSKAPYIAAGYGFSVGMDFARVKVDTPIELAPDEHAKPGHVIGYIKGDKAHPLSFMQRDRIRVHVQRAAIVGLEG